MLSLLLPDRLLVLGLDEDRCFLDQSWFASLKEISDYLSSINLWLTNHLGGLKEQRVNALYSDVI